MLDFEELVSVMRDAWLDGVWMMETTVTQALWVALMGDNPADTDGCRDYEGVSLLNPSFPVIGIRWYDSVRFANALSLREGLSPAYGIEGERVAWERSASGYRLPTEAEWERAARGGRAGERFAGAATEDELRQVANVADAQAKRKFGWIWAASWNDKYPALSPVGSFRPNGYGLYDMSGNVWEWCWDLYGPYASPFEHNPSGALSGPERVVRGGSWSHPPRNARAAIRGRIAPGDRNVNLGVRLVRSAL